MIRTYMHRVMTYVAQLGIAVQRTEKQAAGVNFFGRKIPPQ